MENSNTTPTYQPTSYPAQPVSGSPNKKKNWTYLIGAILIIAALIGVIVYLRQPKSTEDTDTTITITETQDEEPEPTDAPKVDKESVKIQVINGTGTPGQAGTAVDALTAAGYSEDNIETGNAEEFADTPTTIQAKAGFESVAEDIMDTLESDFDDVEIDTEELDEDSEYDIIIVTGGDEYEAPTDAPSAPTATGTAATPTLTPSPTP